MRTRLVKWGNSLGVRIPRTIVRQADMDEGEDLKLSVRAGKIAIEKAKPKLTLEKLLADIRPDNLHGEQDWGKPVGNEAW